MFCTTEFKSKRLGGNGRQKGIYEGVLEIFSRYYRDRRGGGRIGAIIQSVRERRDVCHYNKDEKGGILVQIKWWQICN